MLIQKGTDTNNSNNHINNNNGSFDMTGQTYNMTEDVQIGKLQAEIMLLRDKLNERTMETESLKLALRQNDHSTTLKRDVNIHSNDGNDKHYDDTLKDLEQQHLSTKSNLEAKLDAKNE